MMKGNRKSMSVQEAFRFVVDDAFALCTEKFDGRLDAIYVGGSVATGEAWAGESDIDWFMFLKEEPTAEDKTWCKENESNLAFRHLVAKEFHLNVASTESLRTECNLMKFIFRYNSVCLLGNHHLKKLEDEGIAIPKPSIELAKERLKWVRQCVDGLEVRRVPDGLFGNAIPSDLSQLLESDFLASRKLIRHFILLEGAYLLMLTENFQSFRREDVLPVIASVYPQWRVLMEMSIFILKDPFAAKISPETLIEKTLAVFQMDNRRN